MTQNLSWFLDKVGQVPQANTELIDLSPGNDEGVWVSLKNLRLLQDGSYVFWKLRGGSESFVDFGTNIVSAKGFEARVGGEFKKYIVAQLSTGNVSLRNITDSTTTVIASGGDVISTSVPADFVVVGQFLYIFSYAADKYFTYNLETATLSDWCGTIARPISSYEWQTGEIVAPNIWGVDGTRVYDPPFESTSIYRSYATVDILEDGSVTIPGRPIVVETLVSAIVNGSSSRIGVNLTIPPKASNVARRVLIASRWQSKPELTTQPTSEEYPNSPYFIVADIPDTEVTSSQITIPDRTPDSDLIRPLIELIPMSGGVPIIYGSGQLKPRKASGLKGSLIIGGFDVQRPLPFITTATPNVVVTPGSGTNTSPAFYGAVMFEYSDGSKSSIVDGLGVLKQYTVTPGGFATGQIAVNDNTLTVSDLGIVGITFDGQYVETPPIKSTFSLSKIAELIQITLTGNPVLNARWTFEVSGDDVDITAKEIGTAWNGMSIGVTVNADDPSAIDLSVTATSGGTELSEGGTNSIVVSGLNALVSSVYFLAKTGTDYHLISKESITSGYAHGCPYLVKFSQAEFAALEEFPVPTPSTDPLSFRNFISLAIPAQNPRIDSQSRIVDNSTIMGIVPLKYDADDKSVLRYQVYVLTDQNIQVGYLTEIARQPLNIFDVDLEIIDPSVKAINAYGHERIQNAVIFQSNAGIHKIEGRSVSLLIDKRRYSVLDNALTSVAFNKDYSEVWLFFALQSTVLVYDIKNNFVREYVFGSQSIRYGLYNDDKMLIAVGGILYHTDKPAVYTEFGDDITGSATTDYLTRITDRMKMLELSVYGQDIDVGGFIDLQTARRESISADWVKTFTNDVTLASAPARMNGVSFQIHRRGIKPRLSLNFTNNDAGYIEDIRLKVEINENTGRARI